MLTHEHQDKRLHIEFKDGEIADVKIIVVSECDEHEDCRGIVFDIISTNRPERLRPNSAWSKMTEIKNFEVIED
jgi:hypothetical protein